MTTNSATRTEEKVEQSEKVEKSFRGKFGAFLIKGGWILLLVVILIISIVISTMMGGN